MTQHGTQNGTIHGEVTYREGDGMPVAIPEGPVELAHAPDSVTLSWKADNDAAGLAAMPRDQFERYAREGKILVDGQPAVPPVEATEAGEDHAEIADNAQRQQLQGEEGGTAQNVAQGQTSPPEVAQSVQQNPSQSQGQTQSQSQSQEPAQPDQQQHVQQLADPELSQDGHAVEHDYAEASADPAQDEASQRQAR